MKIWEPKPPGTLWATPGLLRDGFTFTFNNMTDIHNRHNYATLNFSSPALSFEGGRVQIFWNNVNKSKFYSGRN
jgi:hypothetical protein